MGTRTQSQIVGTALMLAATGARALSVVTDTVERVTGRPARTLEQWLRDHAAAFRA